MGITDLEPDVTAALPGVVALVPGKPAASLARWEPGQRPHQHGTRVQVGLDGLGGMLAERLLGALELGVDRLAAGLREPVDGRFGVLTGGADRR
ncbi:hypothetical protein GCM10029964_037430 [Kibdelosporangium lantanae]